MNKIKMFLFVAVGLFLVGTVSYSVGVVSGFKKAIYYNPDYFAQKFLEYKIKYSKEDEINADFLKKLYDNPRKLQVFMSKSNYPNETIDLVGYYGDLNELKEKYPQLSFKNMPVDEVMRNYQKSSITFYRSKDKEFPCKSISELMNKEVFSVAEKIIEYLI